MLIILVIILPTCTPTLLQDALEVIEDIVDYTAPDKIQVRFHTCWISI